MKFLKEKLLLSEKGYSDLKKAIVACTLTNIALLLPAGVTTLLFWQLLNPFYGKDISWGNMWGLLIVGIIASLLVFLAARNDYRKTYLASYKEASNTRLRIAEHLRNHQYDGRLCEHGVHAEQHHSTIDCQCDLCYSYLCLSGLFRLENGSGIVCYHAYYIPDYLGRAQLADTHV